MQVDIDDEVIAEFNREEEEIAQESGEHAEPLTPKRLKEIVEDYLADYNS